jgi:prophage regulatory protein
MKSQVQEQINASLPPSGFLRLKQVLQFVPIGRSTLYHKMKLGTFPKAIKLGRRITAWRADDIHEYMRNPR